MSHTQSKRAGLVGNRCRTPRWTLGDVIDFEEAEQRALESRDAVSDLHEDRRALLEVCPMQEVSQERRPTLFRAWLDVVRIRDSRLFGAGVDSVFGVLNIASWVIGLVLGGFAVPAYLAYNGEKPINITVVFFGLIVVPWVITFGSIFFSIWLRGTSVKGGIGSRLAFLFSRFSREWKESWKEFTRVLKQHGRRITDISGWLFFSFTQQIACGFGLGALGSILFHVTAVDLAFGWESTLNVGAELMHGLATVIASPWAWFWGSGVPTLDQVRESRFSYLSGMETVSVSATRSWWPFLVGCLVFYVVVPRVALSAAAHWMFTWRLASLDFTRTQDAALMRRLRGPRFQTEEPSRTGHLGGTAEGHVLSFSKNGSWNLLIGEGLGYEEEYVQKQVENVLHGTIQRVTRIEVDYADGNGQVLKSLASSESGVVVAIPADTNPVDAIADTLHVFNEASPSKDNVIVLFGPEQQRQDLWRRWLREKQLDFDVVGVPE